jgi:hypothetical protein
MSLFLIGTSNPLGIKKLKMEDSSEITFSMNKMQVEVVVIVLCVGDYLIGVVLD